jgi:N-acyl-D-aspartate/D-glutamate deacylase
MPFDLILRGGEIVDGTGGPAYAADVGVTGEVIVAIGDLSAATAETELDVQGLVVAPGFVDAHTHSDLTCFQAEPLTTASIQQGVTTEICGNCGFSPFPFTRGRKRDVERHVDALLGPRAYADLPAWSASVEAKGFFANLLPLVGHGTIRTSVLGSERRAPQSEDLDEMVSLARAALEQGAAGLSSGLIYTPGTYAQTAEIVELCKRALAGTGRPYVSHVRGETTMVAEAVSEAIAIGREANVPVHISHHKIGGHENWGRSQETLELISRARQEGTDVTLDVYPYAAASTLLYSVLPPWVQEGGRRQLLERLAERQVRERIGAEIEEGLPGWENIPRAAGWDGIVVASAPGAEASEGHSIADLAALKSQAPLDYVAELLDETGGQVIVVLHLMAEGDVRNILAFDATMIGSDGLPLPGRPHPRVAGTFGRVLGHYSREESVLALTQAVRKMTALPAERFGLSDRGVVALGKVADLVAFSAETVLDRASYSEPLLRPEGVHYVVVGGRLVVAHGELTGVRCGRVLGHQAHA